MILDRWLTLMGLWGFGRSEETFNSLMSAYTGKGRHYHSQEHLAACLRHLDSCISQVAKPREVELALWFHDSVYRPFSGGNEQKSADWAASFLSENGATGEEVARVHRLIMVTEHNAPTQTKDESILVDIDLSILGADPQTYDLYERGVRNEFKLVPLFMYNKMRAEVLTSFLERPSIYQNEPFATEREHQAKENLRNAISHLVGRA
jgi:predicted metal-dependent HD superfamily phosphohydrolase